MKILVVDDLPTNRKLFRALLEAEGHSIVEAADGREALSLLDHTKVDAVITDILMPQMDGYHLCWEIRKNPRLKHLPVIISSSTYTSPADAKLAIDAGADLYFKKPVPAKELVAALAEFAGNPKYLSPRSGALPDEASVMKEYSQVLVRKLEEKNSELEKAQAELFTLNAILEERIEEKIHELQTANAELDAFNRSVSHDLKAPLTAVLAYAQLVEEDQRSEARPTAREFSGKIVAAAKRMNSIINELMNLSRIHRRPLSRLNIPISVAVREILSRLEGSDSDRSVETVVQPGLTVDADSEFLSLALENLVGNAWKYTARRPHAVIEFGAIPLGAVSQVPAQTQSQPERIAVDKNSPSSAAPVFFIRDNGAGFDKTQATRLFEPFQRFHSSKEFPGTGIGLTIVHRVITRHGGRIWAESSPGEGATFFFTLSQAAHGGSDRGRN